MNVPQVSGCFDYKIPVELTDRIQIGSLVEVPFGKQIVQGVIVDLLEASIVEDTREILGLIDPSPGINPGTDHLRKNNSRCVLLYLLPGNRIDGPGRIEVNRQIFLSHSPE